MRRRIVCSALRASAGLAVAARVMGARLVVGAARGRGAALAGAAARVRRGAIVAGAVVGTVLLVMAGSTPARGQEEPARGEVIRLPEVSVSAPARLPQSPLPTSSVPASVQVLTGEDVRSSGAVNLQEYMARRLPGVTLGDQQGNAFQPEISFRGFQASPVTGVPQGVSVFLDGVRINEPAVEEINFDLIPLDDIERIELIRGPSAVFGRNTLGGALNIITRRGGSVREVVPEVEIGSFGRQKYRARLGGTEGPIDYYVSGTLLREDGWRDASESRVGKAFGKLGYKADGTDVTVSFQYADNRIEQAGSLPLSDLRRDRTLNFTGGDFFAPQLYFGTLNARQELGAGWSVSVNAFGRALEAEQFNVSLIGENTRLFNDTASAGGTVQIDHQSSILGRTNHLTLGAEYTHHRVAVKVFEEHNDRTLSACVAEAIEDGEDPAAECPLSELAAKVRDRQHAFAVYIQDSFEAAKSLLATGDSLILTAAVRYDWLRHDIVDDTPPAAGRPSATGRSTFSRLNPRIGVNYNVSPDYGVWFSYGWGFRAPAFLELTCASPQAICPGLQVGVAPDPPLKAAKAASYELGVRARPAPWLEAELSLFRTDVFDDIFSISPTGTIGLFFQNIGDTRRQGLELALRGTYRRRVDAYASYTYTEATFQTDIPDLATPRGPSQFVRRAHELPLVSRHRVNAGVDHHVMPWLTLSLGGSYVGSQYLRGDEANVEPKLDGYVVLNAGLKLRWKQLTGFVAINNLLDNEYETFGTFAPNAKVAGNPVERFLTPAPPINVVAGVGYRF